MTAQHRLRAFTVVPKYKNHKANCDGRLFDSTLERNVYLKMKELKLEVELQPRYELQAGFKLNGKSIRKIEYIPDFNLKLNGTLYTLDAKGIETDVSKIKRKIFAFQNHREIVILKSVKAFAEWYGKTKKEERK